VIHDVIIKELHFIPDERGRLIEILRRDDPFYAGFGQVYLTTTYPGVVKAWHCHSVQDDHICCIRGCIKLALFDDRDGSPTRGTVQDIYLGESAPKLVRIPHGIWHGWKAVGIEEAFIINTPTEAYNPQNPDEQRRPWDDPTIPYDWALRNG
jgi:dTDP-4-dehydrorhamnose 3,5-epimerase